MIAGLCAGGGMGGALAISFDKAPGAATPDQITPILVQIDDLSAGAPISPLIYGSNEIGNIDGNGPSVEFDRAAGVTNRRLGGNLMTGYNWITNATHAGKDFKHANGAFLLGTLGVAKSDWKKPASVIEVFLANSQVVGAQSLLTLPLAGFVAADFDGEVPQAQAAPSARFVPIDWSSQVKPGKMVNIPALISFLVARHGAAAAGGVRGYYLDNEPGLWNETHPRIVNTKPTIKSLIERSLLAAKAIKAADPDALVFGPACWGATEMVNFQNAPDWNAYRSHSCFLAAYLDAFRRESGRAGRKLLDVLDVHWYPANRAGDIYGAENSELSGVVLDAPRSLDEAGYCETSWVADALGCAPRKGLYLPLLPSLHSLIAENFPGVGLSIGEFNYGGAGLPATGLAVADVLGRFGRTGVFAANHWGSLAGRIGAAYRLFRMPNSRGACFGRVSLPVLVSNSPELAFYAARGDLGAIELIAINKSEKKISVDLALSSERPMTLAETLGFDESQPRCATIAEKGRNSAGPLRLDMPPMSARRYCFE
jgi:mannan endo-1,4-beta-mannosidase